MKPEGGEQVRLGSFDRETVHTALAFAADGRPDLASMPEMFFIQNDPVLDGMNSFSRRIVLHPAIQDTDLACNAIWLDRFTDLMMQFDAGPSAQSRLLDGWRANRQLSYAEGPMDGTAALDRHIRACGTGGDCFPMQSYVAQGLDLDYYSNAVECKAAGDEGCLNFPGQSRHAYTMTSIVEEQPYELSPDLGFLTGEANSSALWPFTFKMRAVPLARIEGEELSLPQGFTPWDFPDAQSEIDRVIRENLAFEPGARRIQKRMRDFTVLQRMFKTALVGRFGPQFPYEDLVEIQAATREAVSVYRMGNWDLYSIYNGRQDSFADHMNGIAGELTPTLQALSESGSAICAQSAAAALSDQARRPLPRGPGLWSKVSEVVSKCRAELDSPSIGAIRANNSGLPSFGQEPSSDALMRRLSFREIVSTARNQDLIADAIMMGRGGFNQTFFSCPAR